MGKVGIMDTIIMEIGTLPAAAITVIAFILGICLTVVIHQMISRAKAKTFEQDLQRQIDGANREAENIIKSAQIDAADVEGAAGRAHGGPPSPDGVRGSAFLEAESALIAVSHDTGGGAQSEGQA